MSVDEKEKVVAVALHNEDDEERNSDLNSSDNGEEGNSDLNSSEESNE